LTGRCRLGAAWPADHGISSGQSATVAQGLDHVREPGNVEAAHSAGIVLDREVDVSRGDWLLAQGSPVPTRTLSATVASMNDEPLAAGRSYWAYTATVG